MALKYQVHSYTDTIVYNYNLLSLEIYCSQWVNHIYILFQVLLSMNPRDILLITLNHMDAVRKFVEGNDNVMQQVNNVYKLLYQVKLSVWE